MEIDLIPDGAVCIIYAVHYVRYGSVSTNSAVRKDLHLSLEMESSYNTIQKNSLTFGL